MLFTDSPCPAARIWQTPPWALHAWSWLQWDTRYLVLTAGADGSALWGFALIVFLIMLYFSPWSPNDTEQGSPKTLSEKRPNITIQQLQSLACWVGCPGRIWLFPPASDTTQGPTKVNADSRHRCQLHAGQLWRLDTACRYTVFSSFLTLPPPRRDTLILLPQHGLQLIRASLYLWWSVIVPEPIKQAVNTSGDVK